MAEEQAKPVTDQNTAKPGDGKKDELSDKDLEQASGGISWSGSTGGDDSPTAHLDVFKPL